MAFRSFSKKVPSRDSFSGLKRPMRSARDTDPNAYEQGAGGANEEQGGGGFTNEVMSFLRERLDPADLKELMSMLCGDEDLGGMVEEDEAEPPFYGKYGKNGRDPLDYSGKEKRNQGGYQGASTGNAGAMDSRLRTPSARAVNAFYGRFPDAERIG
jgi:hypothetical protein